MMNSVAKRLRRPEHRLGPADGRVFLVVAAGVGLALDADECVEILRECEFVATRGFVVVDLLKIPRGLNAKETGDLFAETWRRPVPSAVRQELPIILHNRPQSPS
jgi:hypothetical protein